MNPCPCGWRGDSEKSCTCSPSVGVARQYTGTIGKVANCQVNVNCHYDERTIAWPIATRLYLPEDWCADAMRRTKVRIPDDVQFQTKPEIALALLDQVRKCCQKRRGEPSARPRNCGS